MKVLDKEFYSVMEQFEKSVIKEVYGKRILRDTTKFFGVANNFYTDGFINSLFIMFMSGYSFGKIIEAEGK